MRLDTRWCCRKPYGLFGSIAGEGYLHPDRPHLKVQQTNRIIQRTLPLRYHRSQKLQTHAVPARRTPDDAFCPPLGYASTRHPATAHRRRGERNLRSTQAARPIFPASVPSKPDQNRPPTSHLPIDFLIVTATARTKSTTQNGTRLAIRSNSRGKALVSYHFK